jgi:hypothetical protein
MTEDNVIPFALFSTRRRRNDRRFVEPSDKPYAGGGIDELWFDERPSAVIVWLY